MAIEKFTHLIKQHLKNSRGWTTKRKIVVIESDDWGSIRMPSRSVYEKCLAAGYPVDQIPYERYDSLASVDDLELLFELLSSIRNYQGNPPVITANSIVANPDFEKIEASGFREYYYEPFTETLERYPEHAGSFQLWKDGIDKGIFYPQYHGREHLNVSMFMTALQQGMQEALFGFSHQMPGLIPHGRDAKGNGYVEATRYTDDTDKNQKLEIILEGADLFEKIFQFKSESLIPPNYIWSPDFNDAIFQKGVLFIQGARKMKVPNLDCGFTSHVRILGQKNRLGQINLVRNATFEPTLLGNKDWAVDRCLLDIKSAFSFGKPAIICSHRLNYVGYIDERNRDGNLKLLRDLLGQIVKRWPDVEFMTSNQLGHVISGIG